MACLEAEMIRCGKLLFERRLISGWGGNLSCRAAEDEFVITGHHAALGFLTPEDLVRIRPDGTPVVAEHRASSETPMHAAIYAGTDAGAIVHVHPPMIVAFSLDHDVFTPLSYEEKFTLGTVPVIAQDTPTVTRPDKVVEALRYTPVVILKAHGTVAVGKSLEDAFLFTDLLAEAIHCQLLRRAPGDVAQTGSTLPACPMTAQVQSVEPLELFTSEHMTALADAANRDREFRTHGAETGLTTSLTLHDDDSHRAWTVHYVNGEITEIVPGPGGEFMISGKSEWWAAVFRARIDPFLATQQGKLVLQRGELAKLARWYKPFQRAFAIWQTIPIQ
jgi:L-fuculose-phosphate aldolase